MHILLKVVRGWSAPIHSQRGVQPVFVCPGKDSEKQSSNISRDPDNIAVFD